MRLDATSVWDTLVEQLAAGVPVAGGMVAVLTKCRFLLPSADWDAFANLPYSADAGRLEAWARAEIGRLPKLPLGGLWFGLVETGSQSSQAKNALYIAGSSDPSDRWMDHIDLRPVDNTYAPLQSLSALPTGSQKTPDRIESEASWALPLAFAALAVRSALPNLATAHGLPTMAIPVAVGFDSGDLIQLAVLGLR